VRCEARARKEGEGGEKARRGSILVGARFKISFATTVLSMGERRGEKEKRKKRTCRDYFWASVIGCSPGPSRRGRVKGEKKEGVRRAESCPSPLLAVKKG